MSDQSSSSPFSDLQSRWREMAEAAARPWQELAEAFAKPWQDLGQNLGGDLNPGQAGDQLRETLTSAYASFAEQQQQVAQSILDAVGAATEQMQRTMEPVLEQLRSFGWSAPGGAGDTTGSASKP